MICNGCGANLPDNSKFCTVCGTKIEQSEQLPVVDVRNDKPVTIEDYNFEPGQTLPLSEQIKRIQIADDVIKEVFVFVESAKNKTREAHRIGNIPSGIVIPMGIAGLFISGILLGGLDSLGRGQILTGLIAILITAAYAYLWVILFKRYKIKGQKLYDQAGLDQQHAEDLLQNNAQAIAFIPPKYRFPSATSYMREMYETGRVQSINEALDKYDEYEHRLNMEMSQSALYLQMQQQQKMLSDTRSAATVGAAASVLNFLLHL